MQTLQLTIGTVLTSRGRPYAECSMSASDTVSDRCTFPSGFTSSSWTSRNCELVTQRAREALNVQRETARRASLHHRGKFPTATHQYEAVARQLHASALARNSEAHNYNVQIQVRQFEQAADARSSQRHRELFYVDCPRKQIKLLGISEKFL